MVPDFCLLPAPRRADGDDPDDDERSGLRLPLLPDFFDWADDLRFDEDRAPVLPRDAARDPPPDLRDLEEDDRDLLPL
jgi:hypothetical protein